MVLVQKELKNAYIGEVIDISSDLRGATLAGLQAQGWTNVQYNNGTGHLDSTGLWTEGVNNGCYLYKELASPLTSSNIITMRATGYSPGQSNNGAGTTRLKVGSTVLGSTGVLGELGFDSFGNNPGIRYNGNLISSSGTLGSGNFDYSFKVNLSTGVCLYTEVSPHSYSLTATLTSSQLSTIINSSYLVFILVCFASTKNIMYTAELTIE